MERGLILCGTPEDVVRADCQGLPKVGVDQLVFASERRMSTTKSRSVSSLRAEGHPGIRQRSEHSTTRYRREAVVKFGPSNGDRHHRNLYTE